VIGILYDIHANLVALEAVVTDARRKGVARWILGGDYAGFGPWPLETLGVLDTLGAEVMLRGNGERWLVEPPPDRPEIHDEIARDREVLGEERVQRLFSLPAQTEVEGMLFVHGSPLSDVDSFHAEPDEDEDRRLLQGVTGRTVVFGHSHLQFRRPGPDDTLLVNPGSVGMPLDRDTRAAWATWGGDFTFHRVEYDLERAIEAARAMDSPMRDVIAYRYEHAADPAPES
jgi:diadenosine tetraphosphatase ApaH/serine/threonine PP2A family protein phosphatase